MRELSVLELSFLYMSSVPTPYERGINQGERGNGQRRRNISTVLETGKSKSVQYICELKQCFSNAKHLNTLCFHFLSLSYNS